MRIAPPLAMSSVESKIPGPRLKGTRPSLPERPNVATVCLVVLSAVSAVFCLRYAQAVMLPFVLGLLVFYVLDPVVSWISGLGVPRALASFALIVLLLGTAVGGMYLLRGQAVDLLERLPEAMNKARDSIEAHRGGRPGAVAKVQQAAGELQHSASEAAGAAPSKGVTRVQIEEPLFGAGEYLWNGSLGLMWFIGQTITIICLVFFLLASGDLYRRKLVEVVGPRLSRQRLTVLILNEIDRQIGRFLLIQLLAGTFIGVIVAVSLWFLGVNQAAMWGVLAGVLNLIPYFGAIIVTVALALVAFLQFGDMKMVVLVAGVTLFVTTLDGLLIKPVLTSKVSRINNLAVFVSLLFWGWLWGALGMLLAVPITMVLKSICDHIEELKPISHLLGEGNDV